MSLIQYFLVGLGIHKFPESTLIHKFLIQINMKEILTAGAAIHLSVVAYNLILFVAKKDGLLRVIKVIHESDYASQV